MDSGSIDTDPPNGEARNNTTHGVLKLTLYPARYDWEFIPIAGPTFTDSGDAGCVAPQASGRRWAKGDSAFLKEMLVNSW